MNGFVQDGILHVTYRVPTDLPLSLLQLADEYEGAIPHRVGWNFPLPPRSSSSYQTLSRLFPFLSPSPSPSPPAYLIVYPVKDIATKKHELLHARYAMNPTYRHQVRLLWQTLSSAHQNKVLHVLRSLQYPDREELLLDEFQAYYFTEPLRFFGISSYSLPSSPSPSSPSPSSPSPSSPSPSSPSPPMLSSLKKRK